MLTLLPAIAQYVALAALKFFCHTGAHSEIGRGLRGYRKRCDVKGVEYPIGYSADICCKVRGTVQTDLTADIAVCLDFKHFADR